MNFFFTRRFSKQIRKTIIPVREEFLQSLRASLVDAAEEDHGHSCIVTIKNHKRALVLIVAPVGVAIALLAVQMTRMHTPNPNGVLDIPAALAESITNTFTQGSTADFTHQRFAIHENTQGEPASDLTVDAWKYGENSRLSLLSSIATTGYKIKIHYLLSQVDNQSCTYAMLPAQMADEQYRVNGALVGNTPECNDVIEVNMSPLIAGDLALNNVHIEDVPAADKQEGVEWYFVWSTTTPMQPGMIFSMNNTGYDDASGSADAILVREPQPTVTQAGSVYTYRAPLYALQPGIEDPHNDNVHMGDYDTQLVQVQSDGQQSAVYQIHLTEKQVDVLSHDQLSQLQDEYKKAMRTHVAANQSPNEIYTNFFQQALAVKDQLSALSPLSQSDELYQGQQAVRLRYAVPDVVRAQEEFATIAQVEFVMNMQNKQILYYAFFDAAGTAISTASVEASEVVHNVDPTVFFSVAYWKKAVQGE